MVGGRGTLAGPFIGAFFVTLVPEWLRFTEEYYLMVFAIFVMVLIIFFPQGWPGLALIYRNVSPASRKEVE